MNAKRKAKVNAYLLDFQLAERSVVVGSCFVRTYLNTLCVPEHRFSVLILCG